MPPSKPSPTSVTTPETVQGVAGPFERPTVTLVVDRGSVIVRIYSNPGKDEFDTLEQTWILPLVGWQAEQLGDSITYVPVVVAPGQGRIADLTALSNLLVEDFSKREPKKMFYVDSEISPSGSTPPHTTNESATDKAKVQRKA